MDKAERVARAEARKASEERMRQAHDATLAVVRSGVCPDCGAGIRRNSSMTGWYQCAQFGSDQFRADASKPSCSWQGFAA